MHQNMHQKKGSVDGRMILYQFCKIILLLIDWNFQFRKSNFERVISNE
jgi:hypothetical protein